MFLPEEKGDFSPCPEGNHLAICTGVVDLGTHESEFADGKKKQRKIHISWMFPDERREDGEPFMIGNWYTLSSDPKSNLRQDLEKWRGRKFKDEELGPGRFDIRTLLLVPCFIQVVHKEKDGKSSARVQSISTLPKGFEKPNVLGIETTYFSMQQDSYDVDSWDNLPDWMKDVIKKSPEGQAFLSGGSGEPEAAAVGGHEDDDDIPF